MGRKFSMYAGSSVDLVKDIQNHAFHPPMVFGHVAHSVPTANTNPPVLALVKDTTITKSFGYIYHR